MVQNDTQKSQKTNINNFCQICNYYSNKKNDFEKHLQTTKHKNAILTNNTVTNGTQKSQMSLNQFTCQCGKSYKYKQGLYRHQKNCKFFYPVSNENNKDLKNILLKLIEENSEMKNIIMKQQDQISELIPKLGDTTNNMMTKNKFNINVFLNEKCKDALSMDKFIDNIQISINNLLTTKDKGNVEGISNIIMDNINKLSLYERPLHCTDLKRETLYVKNHNEWEKDNDKKCINNAIKRIENKQLQNIKNWLDQHPNWEQIPQEQEEYIKLVKNCTTNLEEYGGEEKIIKKLCNELFLTSL